MSLSVKSRQVARTWLVCTPHDFFRDCTFCMWWEGFTRGALDHRRGAVYQKYLAIHGEEEPSPSHPRAVSLQGSAGNCSRKCSPAGSYLTATPWHLPRARWHLFGSTFFTRKTTWYPWINTLLLAKGTVLFCVPLKTHRWPLVLQISIQSDFCWSMRKIRD